MLQMQHMTGSPWKREHRDLVANTRVRFRDIRIANNESRVILNSLWRAEHQKAQMMHSALLQLQTGDGKPSPGFDRETMASQPFVSSVLVKPVSDLCNLRCSYCYEGEVDVRVNTRRMPDEILERIISETLGQARHTLHFLWHGGEPFLAGLDFYRKALSFQDTQNTRGISITNGIQTNGTLLNEQWCEFFANHNFHVGVSIDGPEDLHDRNRYGLGKRGSFRQMTRGLKLLQDYKIPFTAIVVVTADSNGRAQDVFNVLRELGVDHYDVHPGFGMETSGPKRPVEPKVYSQFVINLFENWLTSGREEIYIPVFEDIFQALIGSGPSTCYFAGTCSNIVGIEANGDVIPCTRPFDKSLYTFGNIRETSLPRILEGDRSRRFTIEDHEGQRNSQSCPWYAMCHNGCPQHRVTDGERNVSGANLYCSCQSGSAGGFSEIFEHVVRRTVGILERSEND